MEALKAFWSSFTGNLEDIPVIGPLLLQLTNQALWIMILSQAPAYWVWDTTEAAWLAATISLTGVTLAGMRQWRDVRVAIDSNRAVAEGVVSDALHAVNFEIPVKGRVVRLNIPDEWEPEIANKLIGALVSAIPDEAA